MFTIHAGRTPAYCDGLSRRSFLKVSISRAGGCAEGEGRFDGRRPAGEEHLGRPHLARWRPEPHGHVRHEAGGAGRISRHLASRSGRMSPASRSASCFRCKRRWPTSFPSSARSTTTTAIISRGAHRMLTGRPGANGADRRPSIRASARLCRGLAGRGGRNARLCGDSLWLERDFARLLRSGLHRAQVRSVFETDGDPNDNFKVQGFQLPPGIFPSIGWKPPAHCGSTSTGCSQAIFPGRWTPWTAFNGRPSSSSPAVRLARHSTSARSQRSCATAMAGTIGVRARRSGAAARRGRQHLRDAPFRRLGTIGTCNAGWKIICRRSERGRVEPAPRFDRPGLYDRVLVVMCGEFSRSAADERRGQRQCADEQGHTRPRPLGQRHVVPDGGRWRARGPHRRLD